MIGYLRGKIVSSDIKSVILDVSGVGYKIFTNNSTLDNKNTTLEYQFFTYLSVRENALDLYGFQSKKELEFFELLLTVSGIGPKSAMTILSVASIPLLTQAITQNDSASLVKIGGLGKKNAEKIVLELKDKIEATTLEYNDLSSDSDSLEALTSLGYSERQAREALKVSKGENTAEKIKSALKYLSK